METQPREVMQYIAEVPPPPPMVVLPPDPVTLAKPVSVVAKTITPDPFARGFAMPDTSQMPIYIPKRVDLNEVPGWLTTFENWLEHPNFGFVSGLGQTLTHSFYGLGAGAGLLGTILGGLGLLRLIARFLPTFAPRQERAKAQYAYFGIRADHADGFIKFLKGMGVTVYSKERLEEETIFSVHRHHLGETPRLADAYGVDIRKIQ